MGPTTLVLIAVATVIFLLVVLVFQASLAKLILQDVRGSLILQGGCPGGEGSNPDSPQGRIVRSYAVVADVATSSALNTAAPPPSQTGSAPCSMAAATDGTKHVVVGPASYGRVCWLALVQSPGSAQLWSDVAANRVSTLMISNVSARVWTMSSWPSGGPSPNAGEYLFVLASPTSAVPAPSSTCTTMVPTIEILGDQALSDTHVRSPWRQLVSTLTTAASNNQGVPMHVWGY